MFIIRKLHKFTEQDDYGNGCLPDTATSYDVPVSFKGESADDVIKKAADFVGCGNDGIELDACDEIGRVDFAVTEGDDGSPLTDRELAQWKAGEIKAYYAVYTGIVERTEIVQLKF